MPPGPRNGRPAVRASGPALGLGGLPLTRAVVHPLASPRGPVVVASLTP